MSPGVGRYAGQECPAAWVRGGYWDHATAATAVRAEEGPKGATATDPKVRKHRHEALRIWRGDATMPLVVAQSVN